MADKEEKFSTADIQKIPNAISGDGRQFVAQLKQAFIRFAKRVGKDTQTTVDDVTSAFGQVSVIDLLEQHTSDANGQPENDILVTWKNGNVSNYNGATIWYKYGDGEYQYAGDATGNVFTIKGVATGQYSVKVVGVNKYGISCSFADAPHEDITVQGTDKRIAPPDQFGVTWEGGTPHWYWRGVNDADYFSLYELRENTNPGKYKGMLDSTTDVKSTAQPSERSGTAYLFVRNQFGLYGQGLAHQYELATPAQPAAPTIQNLFQGFNVVMDELPANASGYQISAKDTAEGGKERFYLTQNAVQRINALDGNFDFKYRYYDCFGGGEWSPVVNATVHKQVDGSDIADGAISSDKIAPGAVTVDQLAANAVTADKIMVGAVTADAIASNSISTEKLAADNIQLNGGLQISGGAVNLSEDGLKIAQADGTSVRFNGQGMISVDANGNIYNVVSRMLFGTAQNGQYVRFPHPWPRVPSVIVTPISLTSANNNMSDAIIQIHCYARAVTVNGFYVVCYSSVDNVTFFRSLNNQTVLSYSGIRVTNDNEYTLLARQSASFNIDIANNTREFNITVKFNEISHHQGHGIIRPDSAGMTVSANGKRLWSGSFVSSNQDFNDNNEGWKTNNWDSKTFSTPEIHVTEATQLNCSIWWCPVGTHPGKSSDRGDQMEGNIQLVNINGLQVSENPQAVVDSVGTAMFLALDGGSTNYTVEG